MAKPYRCPHCKSVKTTWKGYRPVLGGKVRLRRCNNCGRKFTTKVKIKNAR